MIIECPHCFKRVLPTNDNCCPACSKDVNDTAHINTDLTEMRIYHRQPLPEVCCRCGQTTTNFIKISHSEGVNNFLKVLWRVILFTVLLPFQIIFISLGGNFKRSIKIMLPVCRNCLEENAIEPRNYNWENHSMTFLVNRKFKSFVNPD